MYLHELDYPYPPEAVATEPSRPTRVALRRGEASPVELNIDGLLEEFRAGDLLVINDTRVEPARIFTADETEILFLRRTGDREWDVLFPARDRKLGDVVGLPGGLDAVLTRKGLPQQLTVSEELGAEYFEKYGEVALPPYIQAARGERHNRDLDASWYQTAWAQHAGSVAAPTASLHFTADHLARLEKRGVEIGTVTLHVGAGTFLPVRTEKLDDHEMHGELVEIPKRLAERLNATRARGGRVWALGTTVTRALESLGEGLLAEEAESYRGETKLFIRPPYVYRNVDVLLTNFHQPKSTLLALVAAFTNLERVRETYAWAIANNFKLFSYGDLSVWMP